MFGRGEGPRGRAGLRPVAPFRTKVQVRQRQKGHAMFDPVCAVRSSRALRPGEGLDGGKEAMVARQRMKAGPGTEAGPAGAAPAGRGTRSRKRPGRGRAGAVGLAVLLVLTSGGKAQELPAVSTRAE